MAEIMSTQVEEGVGGQGGRGGQIICGSGATMATMMAIIFVFIIIFFFIVVDVGARAGAGAGAGVGALLFTKWQCHHSAFIIYSLVRKGVVCEEGVGICILSYGRINLHRRNSIELSKAGTKKKLLALLVGIADTAPLFTGKKFIDYMTVRWVQSSGSSSSSSPRYG